MLKKYTSYILSIMKELVLYLLPSKYINFIEVINHIQIYYIIVEHVISEDSMQFV